jgi:hypothetical protein
MSGVAGGKRAGTRRAETSRGNTLPTLGYALAITACIVAWGYLVFAAIEFGTAARGGDTEAWWLLLLATLGAVACLFTGILVGSRLLQSLGAIAPPSSPDSPGSVRLPGARRATPDAIVPAQPSAGQPRPRAPGGHRALR